MAPSTSIRRRPALLLLAAAALAAGAAWRASGTETSRPLAWSDVSAQIAGIELPRAVAITLRSGGGLADFERQVTPGLQPRPVRVDFRRRELVLVSPGPRSSTGYGVRVEQLVEQRRRVLLVVSEVTPALGDAVRPGVTYPYVLLSIPRVDKRVDVDWLGH